MIEPFETTIDKSKLLSRLNGKLKELRDLVKADEGPYQKAMAAHIKHVAAVLLQASKEVASGKLKPCNGRWCQARQKIEDRIGEVPQECADLLESIRHYEAAIYQIEHSRGDPMRVTTAQVETWLSGKTVRARRR